MPQVQHLYYYCTITISREYSISQIRITDKIPVLHDWLRQMGEMHMVCNLQFHHGMTFEINLEFTIYGIFGRENFASCLVRWKIPPIIYSATTGIRTSDFPHSMTITMVGILINFWSCYYCDIRIIQLTSQKWVDGNTDLWQCTLCQAFGYKTLWLLVTKHYSFWLWRLRKSERLINHHLQSYIRLKIL